MTIYRLITKKDGRVKSTILCSTKKYAEKLARGAVGMGFEAYVVPEDVVVMPVSNKENIREL